MLNNVICFVTLIQFPVFLEFYNNFSVPSLAAFTCTRVHLAPKKEVIAKDSKNTSL